MKNGGCILTRTKRRTGVVKSSGLILILLLLGLTVGCAEATVDSCPSQIPADLSGVMVFAADDQIDFQFPLDEHRRPHRAIFCGRNCYQGTCEYHAAEDYHFPAGTPVYAVADGEISFSGPMGGYGWLIVIDHPQANIYSLYGHLSPSRWRLESGPVEKGELIAYLGDPDENGGTPDRPLETHLHFGIRAGERADYPALGEWRWQAGWIKLCPAELGWLQPSAFLISQEIPLGGFTQPTAGLFEVWGIELVFMTVYVLGAGSMFVVAFRKNKPVVLVICGILLSAAGWTFARKGSIISYVVVFLAVLAFGVAVFQTVRRSQKEPTAVHAG